MIALVLMLILGTAFALLYLVPNGIWTERSLSLLWLGLLAIPGGLVVLLLLAVLDRRLARQIKSRVIDE
jgi:divalent metal cation (Fe/Co/Zn/Cd) transporter